MFSHILVLAVLVIVPTKCDSAAISYSQHSSSSCVNGVCTENKGNIDVQCAGGKCTRKAKNCLNGKCDYTGGADAGDDMPDMPDMNMPDMSAGDDFNYGFGNDYGGGSYDDYGAGGFGDYGFRMCKEGQVMDKYFIGRKCYQTVCCHGQWKDKPCPGH